jgi:hypothetical protein
MRLWSQFIAVALFFPALAIILVLYGLGINSVPEFTRAAFQEAPAVVARSTTAIVEVVSDLLPRSMPVADRKPILQPKTVPPRPLPPPPAPAVLAAVETPKEPPKKLAMPKMVPERSNPESLDGLPIASPEPRQTAAQNYPGEFASADGGDGNGVFVGNPDAKGEFGDLANETAKSIAVGKPASPPRAPAPPKATEDVVPPAPEVPGAKEPPPLPAAEAPETPKPTIAAVEVPRAPEARPHVAPRFTPEAPLEPNEAVPARVEETPRPSPLVPAPPAVATPKVPTPDPAALFKRAQGYLNLNDFNTARLLLTRASEEGHADATFALAEMYDPAKKRLPGITPDGSLARALYEKAAKLRR